MLSVPTMSFLPEFKIESYLAPREFTSRYLMGASDLESLSLAELLALADRADRTAWDTLSLGYTETRGSASLREAIAGTYESLDPRDVLCFAGAEEAIFAALRTLLGPDDHAVVITPCYQSAETVPSSVCATTGVPLDPEDDWNLDLDRLESALRANTRVIYINFPHNPTGKILDEGTYQSLIEIAQARGIYLFSDEVYRLMERDPQRRLPQVADRYERGLSLNVMSKSYGLAGLRIGWIACQDRALLERLERAKHYLSICNSAPGEHLALIALKAREVILSRNRAIVEHNRQRLDGFLSRHADRFDWYPPDGGCIGYPRYRGAEGVESFAARLMDEAGICVVPASVFQSKLNPAPTDRFRIGFGRRSFPQGLEAMERIVDQARA